MSKKVALVTGASSGIGKATALKLIQAGYIVYGTSRQGNQSSTQNSKPPFELLKLDVTNDESVQAVVEHLLSLHGRIDLLVNNAGFGVAPAGAEESSIAQAQAVFDTNFFGIVRMTCAVLPQMRQQKSGRIINIGSVLGFLPMPYMSLYAASKHAVAGYSESLDHEVRTWGIRVSVVEPAYTNTSFEVNLLAPDATLSEYHAVRTAITLRMQHVLSSADTPDTVAAVVTQVALAQRPKLRYTAGKLAGRLKLLRRFAPAGVLDQGVRKDLGL